MKSLLLLSASILVTGSLVAADADLQAEVKGACKKLADKANYSWHTDVESAGGPGGRRGGPTDGKTEKGGYTVLTMTRGDNTTEAVLKGDKGAIKTADGWQSLAEAAESGGGGGGQRGGGRFLARMLQNYKTPAVEAEELAGKVKALKKDGDAYAGELTEEGARGLMAFGRGRGGGEGPAISNAKGSVKFWIKDGLLSKYEFKVQGSMSFGGNDVEIDRTTTVEITDVGTTKIEVSEDAKKKLS
ncbi:MAG TPA: hypothetical protein VNO52_10685 [Methylomirabilota bacterium]|nr:hypothetical protein [Methylomirabilota bacterium]